MEAPLRTSVVLYGLPKVIDRFDDDPFLACAASINALQALLSPMMLGRARSRAVYAT